MEYQDGDGLPSKGIILTWEDGKDQECSPLTGWSWRNEDNNAWLSWCGYGDVEVAESLISMAMVRALSDHPSLQSLAFGPAVRQDQGAFCCGVFRNIDTILEPPLGSKGPRTYYGSTEMLALAEAYKAVVFGEG